MAATMKVTALALEHVLDFPEDVRITGIEPVLGGDGRTFRFVLEGTDPDSGEDLKGEVNAQYSQDDSGVISFEGFHQVE